LAWTTRFQRVELCIASARTTLAVSAVAPSQSFSAAAANQINICAPGNL